MGMQSKSVETASNLPLILTVLPLARQRLRADRVDAGVAAGFAAVPAVHAVHRDHPRAAARHPARLERRGSRSAGAVVIAVGGYVWSMAIYERKSVR